MEWTKKKEIIENVFYFQFWFETFFHKSCYQQQHMYFVALTITTTRKPIHEFCICIQCRHWTIDQQGCLPCAVWIASDFTTVFVCILIPSIFIIWHGKFGRTLLFSQEMIEWWNSHHHDVTFNSSTMARHFRLHLRVFYFIVFAFGLQLQHSSKLWICLLKDKPTISFEQLLNAHIDNFLK